MSFSDETLMAYADGELDEKTRREVEQAMRHDPSIAERIRKHKALRDNVFNAFASTLDEAVPQRLHAAARSGKVVHLDSVRQLRTPPPPPSVPDKQGWSWPQWGALAATLVVGVLAGSLGTQSLGGDAQMAAFDAGRGALVAEGRLAQALTAQLASSAAADAPVRRSTRDWAIDTLCFVLGLGFGLLYLGELLSEDPVTFQGWAGTPDWLVWTDFQFVGRSGRITRSTCRRLS